MQAIIFRGARSPSFVFTSAGIRCQVDSHSSSNKVGANILENCAPSPTIEQLPHFNTMKNTLEQIAQSVLLDRRERTQLLKKLTVDLCSAIFWAPHPQRAQVLITVLPANYTPYQPLTRTRSPDGAITDCGGQHLITAYYSFIDPVRTLSDHWKLPLTKYCLQYSGMSANSYSKICK